VQKNLIAKYAKNPCKSIPT